jgi:hypothetical protein
LGIQLETMATNEDLAIAFLCLCDTKDKEYLLERIQYSLRNWGDVENKERVIEAVRLPTSLIQRKIALLHTGLYSCPQKHKIYEEMANTLGNLTAMMRSPLLKAKSDFSSTGLYDSNSNPNPPEHIMDISLYPCETPKK